MSGVRRIDDFEDFKVEYDRVRPWLRAALDRSCDAEEVRMLDKIASREWTLWTSPNAGCCTSFLEWDGRRMLVFALAGGDLDEMMADGLPIVEAWAKENDCSGLLVFGRRGFERKIRSYGFRFQSVTLMKEIDGLDT